MTHRSIKWAVAPVLGMAVLCTAGLASAGSIGSSLKERLEQLGPDDEVAVIIRLKDKADVHSFKDLDRHARRAKIIKALRDKAAQSLEPLRVVLNQGKVRRMRDLWLINGVAATVPAHRVGALANKPWVGNISLDMTLAAPTVTYGVTSTPGWNLAAVAAPDLWQQGFTGQGVVVATLDSGVDTYHPDVGSRWRGGSNSWFDPYGQHATPVDMNGHGTHVAGLILGGDASGQVLGVAPDAQWIAAKIYDDAGSATLSAIHLALQWALDPDGNPDVDDAPDVVNNSWGLPDAAGTCNPEFAEDIAALRASDIAVVFAAGNSGPNASSDLSPGNSSPNLVTGAVDETLTIAPSSSRGPSSCDGGLYPQVVAPGVNVLTADLTFSGLFPQSYVEVSGTSFAAAQASGTLALLISAVPTASVTELETAVLDTAVDKGALGPDYDYGMGLVNAADAYNTLAGGTTAQPGSLQFAVAGYSVSEDGGSVTLTVSRQGGSSGAVSVDFATSDGSAASGQDYVAAAGTLNFADGITSRTITITIVDDTVYEGNETLSVALANPTGGATLGSPTSTLLTIVDNDPQVVDIDQDGYAAGSDCNDNDASVYPGAPEIKHDGVDQDCNGYDLTIDIGALRYNAKKGKLTVEATSALNGSANLSVDGYGAMSWNRRKGVWQLDVSGVGMQPTRITVSGVEGSETAPF
ncbi:MAG: S8 family serine peptidase [Gammaproteobacteria bacterium]